jgi:hypothetical protein
MSGTLIANFATVTSLRTFSTRVMNLTRFLGFLEKSGFNFVQRNSELNKYVGERLPRGCDLVQQNFCYD